MVGLGPYSRGKLVDFIAYYDIDESGSIDVNEFADLAQYESQVKYDTAPRTFYMKEGRVRVLLLLLYTLVNVVGMLCLAELYSLPLLLFHMVVGSNWPFEPPLDGTLELVIEYYPITATKAGRFTLSQQVLLKWP